MFASSVASGGPAGGVASPAPELTPQEKGRVGGGGWPEGGDLATEVGSSRPQVLAPEDRGQGHGRGHGHGHRRRAENPNPGPLPPPENNQDTVFLHFQFHKDGVSRLQIRSANEEHLSSIFKMGININRAIMAFSRQKNIGNFATKAKLHQAPIQTASTIMGRFKAGLNPF